MAEEPLNYKDMHLTITTETPLGRLADLDFGVTTRATSQNSYSALTIHVEGNLFTEIKIKSTSYWEFLKHVWLWHLWHTGGLKTLSESTTIRTDPPGKQDLTLFPVEQDRLLKFSFEYRGSNARSLYAPTGTSSATKLVELKDMLTSIHDSAYK